MEKINLPIAHASQVQEEPVKKVLRKNHTKSENRLEKIKLQIAHENQVQKVLIVKELLTVNRLARIDQQLIDLKKSQHR